MSDGIQKPAGDTGLQLVAATAGWQYVRYRTELVALLSALKPGSSDLLLKQS